MDGEEEMKFYKTDWFLRLASLVIAIVLWFYVVYQENPVYNLNIKNVTVSLNNISSDFDNGKLVILSGNNEKADIKVSGRRRVVASVSERTKGNVYVDMSNITSAGEYTLPINAGFGIDGVDVVQIKPDHIKVKVDKVVTEERNIEILTKGQVAAGYAIDSMVISPVAVKLTGPQTVIESVARSSITVELAGVTEDIKGLYKIKLYDADGEEITDSSITKNIEYTDVYGSVVSAKSVPVAVNMSSSRNSIGKTVTAQAEPEQVLLKGKTEALAVMQQADTELIDVSGIRESKESEVSLVLPDGVFMVEDKKIKVKFSVTE